MINSHFSSISRALLCALVLVFAGCSKTAPTDAAAGPAASPGYDAGAPPDLAPTPAATAASGAASAAR